MKELDNILKDYMTTVEAGKLYGVHSRTIRRLIYLDKVAYIKVDCPSAQGGFKYMVSKSSLETYYNPNSYNEWIRSEETVKEIDTPAPKFSFKKWLIRLLS